MGKKKNFTVRLSREAFEWQDVEVKAHSAKGAELVVDGMIEDGTLPDNWDVSTGDSSPYVTDVWKSEGDTK